MSQVGVGVMLGMLCGNEDSVNAWKGAIGKTISRLTLGDDDALHFEFEDGSKIRIADEGQFCCESRYMRTDDDLSEFVGAQLLDGEIKDAEDEGDEDYGIHEIQFLEIKTSKGSFVMSSHNEHNGYYGGFLILCSDE